MQGVVIIIIHMLLLATGIGASLVDPQASSINPDKGWSMTFTNSKIADPTAIGLNAGMASTVNSNMQRLPEPGDIGAVPGFIGISSTLPPIQYDPSRITQSTKNPTECAQIPKTGPVQIPIDLAIPGVNIMQPAMTNQQGSAAFHIQQGTQQIQQQQRLVFGQPAIPVQMQQQPIVIVGQGSQQMLSPVLSQSQSGLSLQPSMSSRQSNMDSMRSPANASDMGNTMRMQPEPQFALSWRPMTDVANEIDQPEGQQIVVPSENRNGKGRIPNTEFDRNVGAKSPKSSSTAMILPDGHSNITIESANGTREVSMKTPFEGAKSKRMGGAIVINDSISGMKKPFNNLDEGKNGGASVSDLIDWLSGAYLGSTTQPLPSSNSNTSIAAQPTKTSPSPTSSETILSPEKLSPISQTATSREGSESSPLFKEGQSMNQANDTNNGRKVQINDLVRWLSNGRFNQSASDDFVNNDAVVSVDELIKWLTEHSKDSTLLKKTAIKGGFGNSIDDRSNDDINNGTELLNSGNADDSNTNATSFYGSNDANRKGKNSNEIKGVIGKFTMNIENNSF